MNMILCSLYTQVNSTHLNAKSKLIIELFFLFRAHQIAFDYDTAAMRFRDLKVNSVIFGHYDLYLEGDHP